MHCGAFLHGAAVLLEAGVVLTRKRSPVFSSGPQLWIEGRSGST